MNEHGVQVFLVLDPVYGDKAKALATVGPVWLVRSEANEKAARNLWATGQLPPDHVTVFNVIAGMSPEDRCIDLLGTIDDHHHGWRSIELIGFGATPAIEAALATFGTGVIDRTATGFRFRRVSSEGQRLRS